jgi:hypothetical protein
MELESILNNFHFQEMNVSSIKHFDALNIDTPKKMEEAISFYYEMEYKWFYLTTHKFTGLPQRKENILKIIEEQSKNILKTLSEDFIVVFNEWLQDHAITDPRLWAERRVENLKEDINHLEDIYPFVIDNLYWKKGLLNDKERIQYVLTYVDKHMDKFPPLIDFFKSLHEGSEEYEELISVYDFVDGEDIINDMENWDYDSTVEFLIELFQYIAFPAWYGYWKKQGIDKTRKNNEQIHSVLLKIESYPLKEQFGILNVAINAVHQGGRMLEYFEDRYGVGEEFFDQFEEEVPDEWENELKEIGVDMSTN